MLGISKKVFTKINKEKLFVFLLLSTFFLVYTSYAWYAHTNLATSMFDLGLQEQVIANTSVGRWFASSPEVNNFLGDHVSLLFLPLALIYRIFPYTLTLFVIQALCVTIGLLGFYNLSKLKLKSKPSQALLLFGMLLYWPLAGALTFDFHEIVLAFPLLSWGIYFLEKKFVKTGILLLLLATLAKEDVGIFVCMIGIYHLLFNKKKWGIILAVTGLLISLIGLFVIIPYFREGAGSDTLERYGYLLNFTSDSLGVIDTLINRTKFIYLLKIFVPVFPILLILPQSIVIIGPNLLINLLSSSPHMVLAAAQYDVLISAGVFYLLVLAFENIEQRNMTNKKQKAILFLLACCYLAMFIFHPLVRKYSAIQERPQDYQYMQELKKKIPKQASILASNNLGGQLGQFPNLYLLDPPWLFKGLDSEYVVVDKLTFSQSRDYSQNLDYEFWESNGNIVVYKRIKDNPDGN